VTDQPVSRLLADEHIAQDLVRRIRLLGHDVVMVRSLNEDKQGDGWTDEDVLDEAILQNRAVLTDNIKHFKPLAEEKPWHCGIIACAFDADYQKKAKAIDERIREEGDLRGKWVYVPASTSRKGRKKRRRRQ
jgi:Domain of unknown function (DUF5615)